MRAVASLLLAAASLAVAEDVSALLDPLREKHGLPALAAASVVAGEIRDAGAAGLRRNGGVERVTIEDKWHLGSCTKSMTASLAAMLVEEGKLRWDTTVEGALNGDMHEAWRGVTLEQLLSHRAGAPHHPPVALWIATRMQAGTPTEQRAAFVSGLLRTPPDPMPGTKFVYSNQGYSIAGAMIEKTTGNAWEELMRARVFGPLGLASAGFGAPGSADKADQPWGHIRAGKALGPVTPGPMADNPPAIGPGGTVHMSIGDFARYAAWHADEGRRDGKSLRAESFKSLHTARGGGDYALGWTVLERKWAGGRVLTHTGSNTVNFAVMWVAPERDFAAVATTNAPGEEAAKGCDDAVALLIRRWEAGRK